MKKLIGLLIAFSLVFTMFSCYISAGEEYAYQTGVNMMPAGNLISFQNESVALAQGTGLVPAEGMGTTEPFNLIAPEGGATVLLFMEFNCYKFPMVKQLLCDFTTAGWLDDPRLKIMAVNVGEPLSAAASDPISNYVGSYQNSIQWYDNGSLWLSYFQDVIKNIEIPSNSSPWCAIFQNEGTMEQEGYTGCTVPAYTMKYFDCSVTVNMLENTLDYMFPGIVQQNERVTLPQNEIWNVSFEGTQHNDYVYEVYDLVMDLRTTKTSFSNEEIAMDLDAHLTQCAMQRARELAMYYSHTRPDGTAPETVANEMGYSVKNGLGENIGFTAGESNEKTHAQRMMQGWYESTGHRENMLNNNYDRIGIGCFEIGGIYYWVQMFDSMAGPSKAPYQKTGREKVVATVRTNTGLLNLQVRSATYVEKGETLPYRVIHMPTSKNGLEFENLVGIPLAFAAFDTGVKDKNGKVVANVVAGANNITLNITQNAVESGSMTYKIAPEQKNAVSLTVHGKEPHTEHNYFYGGCFVHPTYYKGGCKRFYCFCGAYRQEEIPKLEYGEEYLWQDRVNMKPAGDLISFQNQRVALAQGTGLVPLEEMGTTQPFNLIAPQGGATILLLMEFDCHKFPAVKQLLSDLNTAGWLDDPRLKIMAVNTGGQFSWQFKDVVFNYAGSYANSIQWYDNGASWLTYFYSYAQSTDFYPGNSPWCAIFQNEGTLEHEGYDVCTLPAYTMKYFDMVVTREMLENTIDYMFPGIVEQNETFTPPSNELWSVSFEGVQHNDYVYEAYDLVMNLRDTETGWSDEEIAMDLDGPLTECAMQRAKELAIYCSSTRPDGTNAAALAGEMGYSVKYALGENVGAFTGEDDGQSPAQMMVQTWAASTEHRKNMLEDNYDRIGIGCFEVNGVYYWVHLFDTFAGVSQTPYQKTGSEKVVATVRTRTNLLNLYVRNAAYLEKGETLPYRVLHVPKLKNGTETLNLAGVPLVFTGFDNGAKDKTGKVVASVVATEHNTTLNITQNTLETGTMTYKIAPEQTDAVLLTLYGKESHTEHNYFYGGCFVHSNCYDGGYDRWYCSCGAYKQGETKPIEHIRLLTIEGKAATCQQTGLTEGLYCNYCKVMVKPQEVIPKGGHNEVVYTEGYPATCNRVGRTDTMLCLDCGELTTLPTDIPKLEHKEIYVPAVPATCKQQGKTEGKMCEYCGKVYEGCQLLGYGGHVMAVIPGEAPTCTTGGYSDGYGCTECGYMETKQEKLPKKGHTVETIPGKAATCFAPGYSASYVCSDCGEGLGGGAEVPQLMHHYVTVDGDSRKKCTRCGLFEGEEPPEISEPDPTPPDDPETSTDVPSAGDIDGDTVINAKDALVALKVAVGKAKLTEAQKAVADVNKDGQINAKDALEILKYAVGKPSVIAKS